MDLRSIMTLLAGETVVEQIDRLRGQKEKKAPDSGEGHQAMADSENGREAPTDGKGSNPHPFRYPASGDVFLLKDSEGALRGVLHTEPSGTPALRLLDSDGKAKVEILVTEEGVGSLILYDKEGTPYLKIP